MPERASVSWATREEPLTSHQAQSCVSPTAPWSRPAWAASPSGLPQPPSGSLELSAGEATPGTLHVIPDRWEPVTKGGWPGEGKLLWLPVGNEEAAGNSTLRAVLRPNGGGLDPFRRAQRTEERLRRQLWLTVELGGPCPSPEADRSLWPGWVPRCPRLQWMGPGRGSASVAGTNLRETFPTPHSVADPRESPLHNHDRPCSAQPYRISCFRGRGSNDPGSLPFPRSRF